MYINNITKMAPRKTSIKKSTSVKRKSTSMVKSTPKKTISAPKSVPKTMMQKHAKKLAVLAALLGTAGVAGAGVATEVKHRRDVKKYGDKGPQTRLDSFKSLFSRKKVENTPAK